MAINTALLVSAPILQNYLVDDSTGLPLTNGTVTFYQDNSRTTLKNVYYQTGVPGNYTYITLPNPLTLSSSGTIVDANGNDTLPFFYPYNETDETQFQPYYVVVTNSNGQVEFTRQNFPFVSNPGSTIASSNNQNLLVNNNFWRNAGTLSLSNSYAYQTTTINGNTYYFVTLAPSQHDGFTMPDIAYYKNGNGSTETITFTKFSTDNALPNGVTPEYYINFNCTAASSETAKYIQIPIQLHIENFSAYPTASVSIWVQNVGGQPNANVVLQLFQFAGTGVTSPNAFVLKTITSNSNWNLYTATFAIPSSNSPAVTVGQGGDDAWYLQIALPAGSGVTCNLNIASPSFNLSNVPASNDFSNYDKAAAVFNSPRTGDVRLTISSYMPSGWVPMNDGTIGDASSNATTRANNDTWPLFNLLWNLFAPYSASGAGTTNPICQMVNSSFVPVGYGPNISVPTTAYGDFTANNQLNLTKVLGHVLMGTVPVSSLLAPYKATFTASNDGSGNLLLTVANSASFYKGQPITFTNSGGGLPGNLIANAIYYISDIASPTTFYVSTTYANALSSTYVGFSSAGTGTQTLYASIAGSATGEFAHTQLATEVAVHNHGIVTYAPSGSSGKIVGNGTASTIGTVNTNNNQNSSIAFNVVQPSLYMNFYIKL